MATRWVNPVHAGDYANYLKELAMCFLLQGEDVDGRMNTNQSQKYIANQHMSFLGCEDF